MIRRLLEAWQTQFSRGLHKLFQLIFQQKWLCRCKLPAGDEMTVSDKLAESFVSGSMALIGIANDLPVR
jgi:hypothetical protein